MIQVVTCEEMARLEKGFNAEELMLKAGVGIAAKTRAFIEQKNLPKKVTLLVGRGNNGADAYVAGLCLLKKGFEVKAIAVEGKVGPLNQKMGDQFRKKGKHTSKLEGVILDGLLGTGFKGKLTKELLEWIRLANRSHLPILSIDIASGVNGTTGETQEAIVATETLAIGFPKIGCFIREGWNHTGQLHVIDLGLAQTKEGVAQIPTELVLPKIVRNRHKYTAGLVLGFSGSTEFPGAAKLAGLAALRAGAGIVKILHQGPIGDAPFELICKEWDEAFWKAEMKRAQSVFVGPGLGSYAKNWCQKYLPYIQKPCIIDADALLHGIKFPKNAILTPHRGEVLRLLGLKRAVEEELLWKKIQTFCNQKGLVVVLKGTPTIIFGPKKLPVMIPWGDPGMATAGAGDVLTGVIAAMLAQGCTSFEGAVLGVALHAFAGEIAADKKTSYGLIASDLIKYLPEGFKKVLM